MWFKKISVIACLLVGVCTCLNVRTSAESAYYFMDSSISPYYENAYNPVSDLQISGTTAYCSSSTNGVDTVKITVEQTLEKYSGWFWIWNNVDGANWTKTVNDNTIRLSNTKSGLSSGTYRLKSVFTLTSSSGKTETITIYSAEKSIQAKSLAEMPKAAL